MTNTSRFHFLRGKSAILGIFILVLPYVLNGQEPRAEGQEQRAKLIITFTDIRCDIGNIVMGLYDAKEQWTDNPHYAYSWDKKKLKEGRITVEIDSLPRNRYAIAVLDDENMSITMDFILGLPKEGWGMSTNPPFLKLIAPKFESVAFDLDCPVLRMEIKMNYLNKRKNVR